MKPGPTLSVYNTMVSLCLGHTWDHTHHGLFPPIPYMRPGTTRPVYNSMVSSNQFYTRDQGPLYLPIHYHGLFLPILYMRIWTTLSLYTTTWSLLTNHIHEIMDHSIYLYNTMISSHQFHTWDQGPLYLSIQHHCLFSPIIYMRPGTTLYIHHGLFSPVSYMRPGTTLSIQQHGLFTPIPYMRP